MEDSPRLINSCSFWFSPYGTSSYLYISIGTDTRYKWSVCLDGKHFLNHFAPKIAWLKAFWGKYSDCFLSHRINAAHYVLVLTQCFKSCWYNSQETITMSLLRKELVAERLWMILSVGQSIDVFSNSSPHTLCLNLKCTFHVSWFVYKYMLLSFLSSNTLGFFFWNAECLIVQKIVLLKISIIFWSRGYNSSGRGSLAASKLVKRIDIMSMG